MSREGRRARFVVAVTVAAQVLVPALVLVVAEPPARFGWQMFAVVSPELSATVVDDGERRDVDLTPYLARSRPEVDYLRWLPAHLCDLLDVDEVRATRGSESEVLSCSS